MQAARGGADASGMGPLSLKVKLLLVVGLLVVVGILGFALVEFPAHAGRAISPHRCKAIGGEWKSDVIGHGGYCETKYVTTQHRHPNR
jgi:hypothetical protein